MTRSPFSIIAYNKFIGFADGNILSWCPTMDLLAISMNKMSIWVFRINGERIYSINNKSLILNISWNPNGKFFCVSGVDGYCKIYDSNSGKLVNTIGGNLRSIDLINWCNYKVHQDEGKLDDLFKVDILGSLPKLSLNVEVPLNGIAAINSGNTNYLLDEINDTESLLNFLVTVRSNSEISLIFNGIFAVENIIGPEDLKFMCHANNLDLFHQYFLVESQPSNNLQLLEINLDIPNTYNLRGYLTQIILHSCKIKSIMAYINEQLTFLREEVKPFIQLFDRHLSNLKDSLYADVDLTTSFPTEEELKRKIVNTLFDILLTGLIPVKLKDYWLNQLGERGIKKLSKVGNAMYDSIRKISFQHLISSLERLLIILNTFLGLVKWFDTIEIGKTNTDCYLGLNNNYVDSIVEMTKKLLKHFYKLIWDINQEQKLFNNFLNWVKSGIIDKLAKEDDLDSYYKSLHVNYETSDLVKYFNEYLFNTKLFNYFEVNLPMNEVFSQENISTDLNEKYVELNGFVETNLLNNIAEYIKSITRFQTPSPLGLTSGHQERVKIFHDANFGIISCVNSEESTLTLIKFSLTSPELQRRQIKLKNPIINYEFINEKKLVLLIDSPPNRFFESFDFESIFTQLLDVVYYDSISPINQNAFEENTTNQISKPKYLAVNNEKSRLLGCLLDSNKQNYVIFELQ